MMATSRSPRIAEWTGPGRPGGCRGPSLLEFVVVAIIGVLDVLGFAMVNQPIQYRRPSGAARHVTEYLCDSQFLTMLHGNLQREAGAAPRR